VTATSLGCRRVSKLGPGGGVLAEDGSQQTPQVRILNRRDQLTQVGLHLRSRPRRTVDQILPRVLAILRRSHGLHDQPAPIPRMDRKAPDDVHDLAGAAHLPRRGDPIKHDRGHAAGAVAEHQLQVLLALTPPPDLGGAYEQRGGNLATVLQFSNVHDGDRR
jgi:hypothetical protein